MLTDLPMASSGVQWKAATADSFMIMDGFDLPPAMSGRASDFAVFSSASVKSIPSMTFIPSVRMKWLSVLIWLTMIVPLSLTMVLLLLTSTGDLLAMVIEKISGCVESVVFSAATGSRISSLTGKEMT